MDELNDQTQISTVNETNIEEHKKNEITLPLDKRLCLVGKAADDLIICRVAQNFGIPVITSKTGVEYVSDTTHTTIFILDDFGTTNLKELQKPPHRVLGSVALQQVAERKQILPQNTRPLFNMSMNGVVVCFTGFRKKEDLTRIIPLIHHMGGSIRKDMVSKVTHLIANCCGGDKYQYATTFKVPVMSQTWVFACWEQRKDLAFCATNEKVIATHKLKPFYGARVYFHGFSSEETKHMEEVLEANGGQATSIDDPFCTHVVVETGASLPFVTPSSPEPPSPTFETPSLADYKSSESSKKVQKRRYESTDNDLLIKKPRNSLTSIDEEQMETPRPKRQSKIRSILRKSLFMGSNFTSAMKINRRRTSVYLKDDSIMDMTANSIDDLDMSVSLLPCPDGNRTFSSKLSSTFTNRVVDESSVTERPDGPPKALQVKAEWFWASVQNVACAEEKDYLFDDYLECVLSPQRVDHSHATPTTSSRRKRKRLHETLSSLVRNDSPSFHKRRSSISDAGLLSVSGSFLDCTTSPDKTLSDQAEGTTTTGSNEGTPKKGPSPRQQVFLELVQTESNYVNILHTIMTMFKNHLEDMSESEALLNNTELKIIFGNLPPIYETHSRMLEELRWASSHWSEEISIGNIFLKYSNDLLKAYPPFVNFFETMKEMLVQCDQNKPRFHAFLKVCQTRPECGRQSLQDLLIRPVQRLPSISLLLNDILKHTNKSNSDNAALEKALSAIKEVMTHINEDKRKTEGQRVMFDIFNEIDNCPPDLVSSHRSFITKCEVTELSDTLTSRGTSLVLFLFTDQLEVCKKRSKAFNTLKSPNTTTLSNSSKTTTVKPYKHICMVALNTIKRVIDIRETDECQKVFAFVTRDHQELKERLVSVTVTDEEVEKSKIVKLLCRHIANTAYSADAEKFLAYLEPHQLDIETSDVTTGTLSKAFKFATRTRIKVGRAFSFNKTPSKLKRAMSTMMSPFGSSTNITPASQLANMRLASYNNINELGNGTESNVETPSNDTLVAPLSVQPTRKVKCSSLSVTALKRL